MKFMPKLLAVVVLFGLGWLVGRESVEQRELEAVQTPLAGVEPVAPNHEGELIGGSTPRVLVPAHYPKDAEAEGAAESTPLEVPGSSTTPPILGEFELKYAGTTAAQRKLARATISEALRQHTDPIVERRLAEGDYLDVTDTNGRYNFEELGLGKSGFAAMRHSELGQENWSYLFKFPPEDYPLVDAYLRESEWLRNH